MEEYKKKSHFRWVRKTTPIKNILKEYSSDTR
jgi:hypothetical protein